MMHRLSVPVAAFAIVVLALCAGFCRAETPKEAAATATQSPAEATPAAEHTAPPAAVDNLPKEPPAPSPAAGPKRLMFNFRYQPWADVLDWFADQAGYSLVVNSIPKGTFNYRDERAYTPAEAIDLLNSVLLTKGYTLVLRDRMLMLINLEDEIPPSLVTRVAPEELDHRGKYELVSTRFSLKNLTAEEGQKEIEKLLGPEGRVVVLPKSQQLVITETGGRLREIRDVLARADAARDPAQQEVRWFKLRSVSPDEAIAMLRQVFEIAEGSTATADGSLHLAADPIGLRLLATGTPRRVAQVVKILETVDESAYGESTETDQQAPLQLEVYDVAPADPESVLKVLQTLLADVPGARLTTDPKTGNLIALARPKDQATVRATIDQIRRDAQSVEVIQLRVVDPQLAVLAIGKLFGKDAAQAPSVDADVANRQLLVRGSAGQIAEIRLLLKKMGETFGAGPTLAGGKLRLVPVPGGQPGPLIERVREFWPVMGGNELRVVPMRTSPRGGPAGSRPAQRGPIDERTPVPAAVPSADSPASPRPPSTTRQERPERSTKRRAARVTFAAAGADRVDQLTEPPAQTPPSDPGKPPIILLSTPDGLYLSSEDVEALDTLEKLIDTLQGGSMPNEPKLTVFYLRNADAKTVAERLKELLVGTTPVATTTTTTSGGATPAPPGILGSLGAAGTFGRITPSGPISITPDPRLNALLVQAAPADVDLIEEVLKILDRPDSLEEIPAQPKPRLIPVVHTSASEIAQVVKDVYQDRLSGSSNNRPLSPPEMMMRMFRGRRGGMGGSSQGTSSADNKDALSKMTIGVDTRTNSLVVSAPEALFEEVRDLVTALDRVASQDQETIEVVTLQGSNPEAVRAALASLLGDAVESSTISSGSGASFGSSGRASGTTRSSRSTNQANRRSATRGSSSQQSQGYQRFQGPGGFPGGTSRGRSR